jgi:hypothetical protein
LVVTVQELEIVRDGCIVVVTQTAHYYVDTSKGESVLTRATQLTPNSPL